MEISHLLIATGTAHAGMTVGQAFRECVKADVPGIPFQDDNGKITGKISIRYILKEKCIPDFMVKHSHLLGDELGHLHIREDHAREVLKLPVDPFILPLKAVAGSNTPAAKALAIMEDMDTTYLFVIDDGESRGVVSSMGIARAMLTLESVVAG